MNPERVRWDCVHTARLSSSCLINGIGEIG
jgi:hypothetical protein